MPDLILHHYPSSPFAEKARLMLGFKGLAWHSVTIPVVLPKPDVLALTGAYRRTPLLQMGADVYCDTALIARVLDSLVPTPPLFPASAPLAGPLAQWADGALFWTAVVWALQPAGAQHILADTPPEQLKAFAADRAAMAGGFKRPTLADAGALLPGQLTALDGQLQRGGPWLLGEAPSVADFAAAHPLWFIRRAPPVAHILAPLPALNGWLDRVLAFGHGGSTPMDSAEAVATAAAATGHAPCAVAPGLGFEPGQPVTVAATDYATDATAGTLVGLSAHSVVLERNDERAGTVHVHFPRQGFQIRHEKT